MYSLLLCSAESLFWWFSLNKSGKRYAHLLRAFLRPRLSSDYYQPSIQHFNRILAACRQTATKSNSCAGETENPEQMGKPGQREKPDKCGPVHDYIKKKQLSLE